MTMEKRLQHKLESLVDFRSERILTFRTKDDPQAEYYFIRPQGSAAPVIDELQSTLDRMHGSMVPDEDIRQITGIEKVDGGYVLPRVDFHSVRFLEFVPEYQEYCMNWYEEHGFTKDRIREDFNMKDQTGLFASIGEILEEETGERPMGYLEFVSFQGQFLEELGEEYDYEDLGDPSALDPQGAECPDGYDEEEFDL